MAKNKIIKIAVIGAESTGKSTLCSDLAQHYSTVFVSEYARDYFDKHDIDNYKITDLEKIYKKQIANEKLALKKAKRLLFCDTTLITGKIWAQEIFNKVPDYISKNSSKIKYDLYLLSSNDIPWQSDGQRKNKKNRIEIFNKNIEELKLLKANYIIIDGLHFKRSLNAVRHIDKIFPIKTKKTKK